MAKRYTGAIGYEVNELPALGPIVIDEIGEENFYFTTADGARGFVKLG